MTVGTLLADFVRGCMFAHKCYRFAIVLPDVAARAWCDFSHGYDDGMRVREKPKVVK